LQSANKFNISQSNEIWAQIGFEESMSSHFNVTTGNDYKKTRLSHLHSDFPRDANLHIHIHNGSLTSATIKHFMFASDESVAWLCGSPPIG